MSNDNRRKLYDALSKDYDMGTYEQFCKDIQDDAKRKKLYDATSDAYDYGDYAKFSSQLGFGDSNAAPAPTAAIPVEAVKPEQKGSTAQSKQEAWTPTPMQKAFMIGSAQSSLNSFKAKTDALLEGVRNTSDYYSRGGAINRSLPVKGDLRYNAEAGKMEQTYLTPTGTATADKVAAERETRAYNDYVDNMTVAGQLRRAGRDLEYLTDKAEKRKAEIINKVKGDQRKKESESGLLGNFYQGIRGGDSMVMPSGSFTNEVNDVLSTDREYRSLEAARRDAEKRVRTLQHENDRQNGKNVGFWRGLGEVVGDSRTWDFGLGDLRDATTKVATSSKSNGNRSDAEDLMLGQAFEAQQADVAYGKNDSFWNRAGVMTGEMLPFMLDFAFMGGARGGSSMVTRNLDTVLLRSLHKAAPKVARNKAVQWTTKALGAMPEDLLYRAPLMTNTVQGMKTASDIIDRKLGDVVIREDGTYDFSNNKTWGSAVWQGEANAIIENYSEMFGSHLEGVLSLKTVGKLADTFGAKRLSGILTKASNSELAGIAGTMQKHLNHLGVSDYIGEVGEEYYGQLWRTMLNLDDAYKQNPDGSRTNLFLDGQFHGDIWGGMALSMGLMGAGKYSVSAAAYGSMKHRVNKTDTRAAEVFTPEVWDGWRERIDGTTNDKIGEVAEAIVADPTLTDEQRAAAMNYIEASLNLRGFNLASVARQRGGEMSEDEVAANESYMDGYSASTPQEMRDVKKMLDLQRQRLASALSEDLVQDFDNDPIAALSITHDPELRRIASDYVNAKMVYDGMIQRVRDDVDGRIAQSDAMIDSRINRETGMIQPATMKIDDRKVYIVNGSVSMYEDGTGVDAQNSSESIIIRDAETGKVEFADPTQFLSVDEAIDVETEKDEARKQIINEVAVAAANNIDGVLSFNPGDTYSILDLEGNQQSVSVLGQTADENGMPYVDIQFPDGSIESVATSDLQQWVDDANTQRVEQFDNEHQAQRAAADEAAQPDTEINPDENGVIEIPTDRNGEPIYEQAEPDYAWDALVEQTEGDEDIAKSVIEQTISEKEDELKKMSKQKPKAGLSTSQKIKAEKDKKKAMDGIQQSIDHWKRMAGTKQRRQAEEDAIRRVLNLEYQPITKATTNNGTNGSAVLDVNSEDGQDGRPGSNGNADGAEQSQEGMEVSISSHIIRENQLRNKMKSDRLLYKATALDEPANSPAEQPINQGGSLSSDGKDNTLPSVQQEVSSKRSLGEKVKNAETEVNTDPTDKQKEAGNYKKGHVQVGTFDVSIENPKGSTRSGIDADGKKWETTMTHTYGYIRGTKGVDGDHIDVYISSDVDGWNGMNAYVVDQYNPDGSFDEHKVMLGFNDKDEAFEAYLSNYEKGWKNGRRLDVTAVNLEDFEKWIESSKRKTKPFADYKSVMPIRYDNQGNPIDHLGKLIVEDVNSIDEITDDDFVKPTRTISLPQLPDVVSEAIGSNEKRVIIKKNIFDKNHKSHRDLTPKDSREILQTALYTPSLYGQNQKQTRPYNWILIHLADKNTCVLLEVDNSKECCEIVNWHYLGGEQLKQKERQAEREGGRILTLSEDNVVGNTSHGLSSVGKDNTFSVDNQISEDANRLSVDESSDKQADKGQSSKGYTIESKPYTNKQGKTKPFADYKSIKSKEDSSMVGRSLSEQEATDLIAQMEANAEVAPATELTPKSWITQFGEDGIVDTPLGVVKMGANQLLKLYSLKRAEYFCMIHPTLNSPDVIIEKNAPADGAERDSKYLFVKTFIKSDGSRLVHFESVTVKRDGMEVSISSHEAEGKAIKKEMQNGKILHLSERLSPGSELYLTEAPGVSEGPDLVPTSDNNIVETTKSIDKTTDTDDNPTDLRGGTALSQNSGVSEGKNNTLSSYKQTDDEQSSDGYTIEPRKDTRDNSDIFAVKFDERVSRDVFKGQKAIAKKHGGYWSNFGKKGFLFKTREEAEAFANEVLGKDNFYKTRKDATQRVMDIKKSLLPTSETYFGAILSDGAKLPKFFELSTDGDVESLERDGYGAYSDAEVSMENDPWSKAWGESIRTKRQQKQFAERERNRMRERAKSLSSILGLDIEVIEDSSTLKGKKQRAKGWYDTKTGKITVVVSNHNSASDMEATILHEAVAHHGLRQLLGEHFDEFLDKVYEAAENGIKEQIDLLASRNGWNRRVATEEYLAGLAERSDFDRAEERIGGWFDKIKRFFFDMLLKAGFKHITPNSIGDNELRYILWRSYQNLVNPGRYRAFEWEAEDVAMQYDLKVGDYAPYTVSVTEQSVAEAGELYEVNERFNRELQQQIDGTLPEGHVYQLGNPSEVLLSTGVPNLPIQLSAQRLKVKATEYGHNFDLSQIRNLVKELQHPMAVFVYGNKGKMQNIIVGIESNGNQFIVGLSLNPIVQGKALEINSVRNVFPKKNAEWLNWISQGKLLYADKQKIQALIDKQRTILADVEYLDLEDVAKIVENFENPTIKEQNNNAERDDDVRFRDGDFTPRDRKLAADQYERMLSRGSWQFREATQDSMLGLKTLYESILGNDLRIENVAGYENAYLYENRMSSANNGEQHQYFSRFMKPLLESIHKLCGSKELDRRILTDYMIAKHGLERNEYMRNEAAANGEDTDRDFAGLCGLTGEDDWQVAETVARQMVNDYEADHDTAELWDNVKKATNATLEKIYISGLISEDSYNNVLGMYDFYIPLRGWDETTSDEVYGYLTSKDGPLVGSVFKTAEGRESKADDPIATIAMMADDAIRQGNRNIMKQRFLNFVHGNPSDLVSVNEMWLQHNDVTDEWEPVFADLQPDMTHAEVESEIAKFEAKMEVLAAAEPDKYKKGRDAGNIPYKVVSNKLKEHQVLVKRNGRTYVMTINGNPRAAQALNGLTNPDVETGGVIGNMLKLGEYVNRHLSAFYTTRNPDFVVSNFMRDMLYSNCMMWVKENPRYALRFHKNFGKVNPLTLRRLLSKWENDNLSDSNYLEKMFKEFMLNGGETGYTLVKDIKGHKRTIASELKKQGSTGRKAWSALGMQLDLLNRSAENCARFAAFLTSREMGRTLDRSIYDAKEVSVNFNKKGSGGKFVNATGQKLLGKIGSYLGGGGRIAFVFWNAGIQGMTNFGRAWKRNPGKAIGGAAALFTLGYVIPLLAQMLGGGDGDDDDKNAYYNLPEYVRRSNICFKAGEQWITIPLPIEFRAIYGMGEFACGVISGNERYSNFELTRQMASQVSQIMPLDMLEGGGGISPFIPSALKPLTEAYILNKGWTGLPVYKEDTPYNKKDPEWTKAYQSADQHLVEFTRWLNETSGGNDYKKGTIDINPAKLEYLLTGTFGGAVSTIEKLKKMGETAFGEREFEWRNMLLANRIIKSGDERTANRKLQNEYFKYLNEYEETNRLRKKYENAAKGGILGYAERADFLFNSPEYLRFEIFEKFKPDIDAIRKGINEETDSEKKKDLQNDLFAIMRDLVDKLHDVDDK